MKKVDFYFYAIIASYVILAGSLYFFTYKKQPVNESPSFYPSVTPVIKYPVVQTNCQQDNDCRLIDTTVSYQCCAGCLDKFRDSSSDNVIAVNKDLFTNEKDTLCQKVRCPEINYICADVPNKHEAKCINNICQKIPIAPTAEGKLRVCPEHWISNQMPCAYRESPAECTGREYFIINGERKELDEVDIRWVEQNCSVKREVAY